jgi:hypothetical protein
MQHGMLFHALREDADDGVYVEQIVLELHGQLCVEAFKRPGAK